MEIVETSADLLGGLACYVPIQQYTVDPVARINLKIKNRSSISRNSFIFSVLPPVAQQVKQIGYWVCLYAVDNGSILNILWRNTDK